MEGEKLVFARAPDWVEKGMAESAATYEPQGAGAQHPMIGALKGLLWIDPALDLTKPALDPGEWERMSREVRRGRARGVNVQLLLDTNAAIFAVEGTLRPAAASLLAEKFRDGETVLLSPITGWELGLLFSRGRLRAAIQPREYLRRLTSLPGVAMVHLSAEILLEFIVLARRTAARSCGPHHRGDGARAWLHRNDARCRPARLRARGSLERGGVLTFQRGLNREHRQPWERGEPRRSGTALKQLHMFRDRASSRLL